MPSAFVNKSGTSVNVYSDPSATGNIIGQIVPNEVFIWYGAEGNVAIYFVNPSGNFVPGWLDEGSLPTGLSTGIIQYPYRTLNGYYVFKLRRSATVKNSSGSNVTTFASGSEVACNSNTVGQSYPNFKHIVGTVNGNTIDSTYNGYFVDMGFNYGSSGSTMTLYGTY
ncbi:MAG: hypothetical protein LBL96_12755 [Clostridiales bacterium]|jgi:hypothetical protein|nr:hypothetical protein [Clostridiales bacterium]